MFDRTYQTICETEPGRSMVEILHCIVTKTENVMK